jgi:autotransporter-associated beta strand protein
MKIKARISRALASSVVLVLSVNQATADNGAWAVDSNGSWSTATNWLAGIVADGAGFTADFSFDQAADTTVTLDSARTIGNLVFGDPAPVGTTGSWILSGANVLTLAGPTPTVTVGTLGTDRIATISSVITGAAGLVKAGPGTLVLAAANTYTGSTVVNGGMLTLSAANSYAGGTVIASGATLNAGNAGALGSGAVTNHGTLNLTVANVTYSGLATSMSGTGTLNLNNLGTGSNTVIVNGDYSAFSGIINVGASAAAGAGKIQLNGFDNAATTVNVFPNATVFVAAGTHNAGIVLNGGDTGEALGQLRFQGATTTWAGPVTLAGDITTTNDAHLGVDAGSVGTISGAIGETGGPRNLIKGGTAAGTLVLTGLNTYTGQTILKNGSINVAVLNNTGVAGNLGQHGTIDIGSGGTGATLVYSGTGETTDRAINLAGTTGGAAITQSGASGLLKLTGGVTATQPGRKTLTLQGGTAANGEMAGVISNSSAVGTTLLTTAFAAAATTVTLNSVEGVALGAAISGAGLDPSTTITFINGNVVTLSTPAIGAGVANQAMAVTGVVNASLLTKAGTGTWTLSGANTFTGPVALNGGTLIAANPNCFGSLPNTVTLSVNGGATVDFATDTSIAPYTFATSSNNPSTLIANRATPGAGITHTTGPAVLGNNVVTFAAGTNVTSGTASFTLPSVNLSAGGAGTCTLNPTTATVAITGPTNIGSNNAAKTLNLGGSNVGNRISGDISNGINAFSLAKSGTSTWTVSGINTFTGTTTVAGGTLQLDYSSQDNTKLADVAALVLGGGTLEMAGGTHSEVVSATTLSAGTSSTVTRSGGATGVLHMNTITPGAGAAVRFTEPNIATTDNSNTNGILGSWAFITSGGVTEWASTAGGPDGLIVAYTGYADITRLGPSTVPNDATQNVRIIEGGSSGNITLAGSPLTEINSLQMTASGGTATIAPTAISDVLMVGNETGGGIFLASGSGGLTIGTTVDDGFLTTGLTANATAATLNLINDSGNEAVINATITNNGTDVVSLGKVGTGRLLLNGTNTFTGNVGIGGGSVVVGNPAALSVPAATSTVTVGGGATLDLNGNSISVANLNAPTGSTVTDHNGTPGISTLSLTNQSSNIAGLLLDGANRTLALRVANFNGAFLLSNGANTFSGGIVLANSAGGTRMAPGAITAGAYGTGPIAVGEVATDRVGIYFATANQTLTNPIIANTGLGTDRVGTFRADATGIVLTGTMTAGASDFTVSTNGTGGVTMTGKVTGNNGLKLLSHTLGGTALTVTLSNAAGSNDYLGNTTINENPQAARNYTLALGAADQIPNGIGKGDLIINTNGTGVGKFNLNGFSDTINGLFGNGTVDGVSGTPTLTLGDEDITATFSGVITDAAGALAITKIGTGVQTLSAANTYAGATTVNAGTLVLTSTTTSPGFTVAAGAVLEFAPAAIVTNGAATTFSGLGTIRKTGAGNLTWGGGAATFAMASGSLIDVQNGIFTGGSSANEIWTNNRSDLNVALGARFDGVEENIRVDVLTGAGTVSSGYPHPRYQRFTFGVDGGSGTFDGVLVNGSTVGNFAKEGAGTQTLTGVNTYTGSTTVNGGTLSLAQACLSNTGAVIIASGAVLNLTHSATDVVGSFTINGTLLPPGIYDNATHPASITGSGKLQVLSSFQLWALASGLDGTPGKENGPTADPDGDGDNNLAEFAFGGNPLSGSSKINAFVLSADSDFDADTDKELILTVAVRKTTPVFAGSPAPTAMVDGVAYTIEGGTTLSDFPTTQVNVVPTPITTGLPALGADYGYRSFSLDGSIGILSKGFLRAKATAP